MLAWRRGWRVLGAITIAAALGAAAFDAAENVAILRVITAHAGTPRGVSLWKWASFFVAAGGIVPLLIDRRTATLRRWIGYVGAGLGAFAAVEGLIGVAQGKGVTIEAASGRAAVALLLAVVFFATHRALHNGLLPALNQLAATSGFGMARALAGA